MKYTKKLKCDFEKIANKNYIIFIDKLLYRIGEHRLLEVAAGLVYFSILSIFPFLISLLNGINFIGIKNSKKVLEYLSYLPKDIAKIVLSFLNELAMTSSSSLLSISVIVGLWVASNAITKLMNNVNIAYGFKSRGNFFKRKFVALIFTLFAMFMILILLPTQIFGEEILNLLTKYFDIRLSIIYKTYKLIIPVIYMVIFFSLLYKYSLNRNQRSLISFKLIIPGAIFSTVFTILSSQLFGYYVANFGKYSVTYGSLGGIIVMLIWMWLMNLIILLGAEINAILYSMKHFKSLNLWPRHDSVFKGFVKD